jgi:hypothetical protein
MTRRRFFGAIGAAIAAIAGVAAAREGDQRTVARTSIRIVRDGESIRVVNADGSVSEWTWKAQPDNLALAS